MSTPTSLTHDAFFYSGDESFAAALVPFIRDGLAQGAAIAVAVTRPHLALLHDAIGNGAQAIDFIDRDQWYEQPATTIAGWRRLLTHAAERGQDQIRLIGEVNFTTPDRYQTWTRYEASLNQVFADAPAWIVCPYDVQALPAALLADARHTHPGDFGVPRSGDGARLLVPDLPNPRPELAAAGSPVLTLTLEQSAATARQAVRHAVTRAGELTAVAAGRLADLLVVVSEIVSNSISYGQGRRELRLWLTGPTVICEVSDDGPGPPDPLGGYEPPGATLTSGRGLWIARQLCDGLAIDHHEGRARVRFTLSLARAARPASSR